MNNDEVFNIINYYVKYGVSRANMDIHDGNVLLNKKGVIEFILGIVTLGEVDTLSDPLISIMENLISFIDSLHNKQSFFRGIWKD